MHARTEPAPHSDRELLERILTVLGLGPGQVRIIACFDDGVVTSVRWTEFRIPARILDGSNRIVAVELSAEARDLLELLIRRQHKAEGIVQLSAEFLNGALKGIDKTADLRIAG